MSNQSNLNTPRTPLNRRLMLGLGGLTLAGALAACGAGGGDTAPSADATLDLSLIHI